MKSCRLPKSWAWPSVLTSALGLGGLALVTGEVGSGKSTALRWAKSRLHPSEIPPPVDHRHRPDPYWSSTVSSARSWKSTTPQAPQGPCSPGPSNVRSGKISTAQKKKLVLIIDEASLLRLDVFAELHAITQFDGDSKPLLPIILAGQE